VLKDVIKHEFQLKGPENIEFDLKGEELDSTSKEESEGEEPQTLRVRGPVRERRNLERYSPSAFHSNFALCIINVDPRSVKEEIDS